MRKNKSLTLLLLVVLVMNQLFTGTIFASGIDEGISEEVINEVSLDTSGSEESKISDEYIVSGNEYVNEGNEIVTEISNKISLRDRVFSGENFYMGNDGWSIINGARRVNRQGIYIAGTDEGLIMCGDETDEVLAYDNSRNVNYYDGIVYYTVYDGTNSYIKSYDLNARTELSGVFVEGYIKHMYYVNGVYIYSADGIVYLMNPETGDVERYNDLSDVFSFIPTEYGILSAKGKLFDYDVYVDEELWVGGVSDYYIDGNLLTYTLGNVTCTDLLADVFGIEYDGINSVPQSEFETISVDEFLEELEKVEPTVSEDNDGSGSVDAELRNAMLFEEPGLNDVQKDIRDCAYRIWNKTWITKGKIRKYSDNTDANNESLYIPKGTEIHGVPYAQPIAQGEYIYWDVKMINSFAWYWQEAQNENSKIYSIDINDWSYYKKYSTRYGLDCSGFVSYCWGLDSRNTTDGLKNNIVSVRVKKENEDSKYIKVGDILNKSTGDSHVVLVADVLYDEQGSINKIVIIEQTLDWTNIEEFSSISDIERGYLNAGFVLYRNSRVETNTLIKLSEDVMNNDIYMSAGDTYHVDWELISDKSDKTSNYVEWFSKEKKIADVDQQGNITAINPGRVAITATLYENGVLTMRRTVVVEVIEPHLNVPETYTVYKGREAKLDVDVFPENTAIKWSTNDSTIVTVKDGIIKGISAGTATITAKGNGMTRKCKVTVKNCSLSISNTTKTLYMLDGYNTFRLTATPIPDDKLTTVKWSSSDESVASVNQDGLVTAKKKGTATISVKANGKTKKCTVTVKSPSLSLSKTTISLYPSTSSTLKATCSPEAVVTWKSSDESVARVNEGKVIGVGVGSATITATVHGISKTCKVTVNKPTLSIANSSMSIYVGYTGNMSAVAKPDATIVYSSSNTAVAQVDSKGIIRGINTGTAVISAKAHGITKKCTVTVYLPTLSINTGSMTLYKGMGTGKISATATPSTGIKYSSSNTAVATVSSTGVVTPVNTGTATIYVTAHNMTKSCVVTVKNPSFTINKTTMGLTVGNTGVITGTATPTANITWSSSNSSIAQVSNGTVRAVGVGSATITATANGISRTCKVTVYRPY